jgi:hypothetical protein
MRGAILPIGEYLTGYYYDLVPKRDENGNIVTKNNKTEWVLTNEPIKFHFKDRAQVAKDYYNRITGYDQRTYNLGGVFQTNEQIWKIYTSDGHISFKQNAKVVVYFDEIPREFFIKRVIQNQDTLGQMQMQRYGKIKKEYLPIILELV